MESNNLNPPAPIAEPMAAECGSKFPIKFPVSFSKIEYEYKPEIIVINVNIKNAFFIYPPNILYIKISNQAVSGQYFLFFPHVGNNTLLLQEFHYNP